jgi:hypothetical protein
MEKVVVALLRGGGRVESEELDEARARAELARIHGELAEGRTNKFVQIGENAIINIEDLDRIFIEDAQRAESDHAPR